MKTTKRRNASEPQFLSKTTEEYGVPDEISRAIPRVRMPDLFRRVADPAPNLYKEILEDAGVDIEKGMLFPSRAKKVRNGL